MLQKIKKIQKRVFYKNNKKPKKTNNLKNDFYIHAYLWCDSEVKILASDYIIHNTNHNTSWRYHNKRR